MIEYALLVMLGFCTAVLLAMLIAPTIWNRAVRLTTKRLDATLPMSLSDIEADKDLLRASYAIQIRRLEAGLTKARDKSATQLVEISKLQMVIGEMRDRVGTLEKQLEERRNAANVFERTITKRFPEMEASLGAAKAALDERAYEIADLNNKLRRKEEALTLVQRSSGLQQAEIRKLRETLEGGAADRTGRFKKRPAQWSLEEFRSEYDRLSLELSKMREMLALAQERETSQVAVLKSELQNLAQQIMTSVAGQEKQTAGQRQSEPAAAPAPRRDPAPSATRHSTPPERPLSAPQPWPGVAAKPAEPVARPQSAPPARADAPQAPVRPETPARRDPVSTPARPPETTRRPSIADEAAAANAAKLEASGLKSLLDRAAAMQKDPKTESIGMTTTMLAPVREPVAPPAATPVVAAPAAETPENKPGAAISTAVRAAEAAAAERQAAPAPGAPEPNIDRMLREIFEGRGSTPSSAGEPATAGAAQAATASADLKPKPEPSKAPAPAADAKPASGEPGKEGDAEQSRSLADRLRMV